MKEEDFDKKINSGYYMGFLKFNHRESEYWQKVKEFNEEFKRDLFAVFNVTDNPKAEQLYKIADELSQDSDDYTFSKTYYYFQKFVELIN